MQIESLDSCPLNEQQWLVVEPITLADQRIQLRSNYRMREQLGE